jgi:DNA-directed RNA polymerase specialized sigma24 family protein
VDKVRGYQRTLKQSTAANPLNEAIRAAIDDCIANNVLKDFLTKHRKEVVKMFNHEYNLDDAITVRLEEQSIDFAERLIAKGWTASEAAETAGIPLATLQRYCRLATA